MRFSVLGFRSVLRIELQAPVLYVKDKIGDENSERRSEFLKIKRAIG